MAGDSSHKNCPSAYGQYLAATSGCISCHGPGLSGGSIPGTPPDWPPASNITPSGWISSWSEADFFRALREGKRPGGAPISAVMPWRNSAQMTDDELRALLVYLRSAPAKPYGGR
jgi:mono/diheme cytochrome c family protein